MEWNSYVEAFLRKLFVDERIREYICSICVESAVSYDISMVRYDDSQFIYDH